MAKKHRRTSKVKHYPTDLNNKKWEIIKPLLPCALLGGRPRTVGLRKFIGYALKMGWDESNTK